MTPIFWILLAFAGLWAARKCLRKLRARPRVQRPPSRFPDGRPLTQAERERLDQIERGYGPPPRARRHSERLAGYEASRARHRLSAEHWDSVKDALPGSARELRPEDDPCVVGPPGADKTETHQRGETQ